MENGRCRMHGGSVPKGFAHPSTITGRHSRYLPTRLADRYHEAIADPELLALRDDIGLLDTRIGEVVNRLNTGESAQVWEALSFAWGQISTAWKDMAPDDMERAMGHMSKLLGDGLSEQYTWNEIRGLLKERADLVAGERKRLVEMQQYVTAERAMTFVGAVMASVKQHVGDRSVLAAIAADLGRLALHDGAESAARRAACV